MTDVQSRYRQAARERFDTGDGDITVSDNAVVELDHGREGVWVQARLFVPVDALDPEPGPTYDVWIAEREDVYATVLDGTTLLFPIKPGDDHLLVAGDVAELGHQVFLGEALIGYRWHWIWDCSYTCDDDPDGRGARAAAHEYARYLRSTYPCAFVAVRPAGKPPLPIANGCE